MSTNDKETRFLTDQWIANISALRAVDAQLAERIESAPEGNHVKIENEQIHVFKNNLWHSLQIDKQFNPTSTRIGVFGLGSEAFVERAITSAVEAIILWDRDPAIIKALLSLRDYSAEIFCGRIIIALGADLISHLENIEWFFHPLLSQLYMWEAKLVRVGLGSKRAILATGGLFVDDLWEALEKEKYRIFPLAIDIYSLSELRYTVEKIQPDIALMINYTHGTAEFFSELNIPFRCWEIDPATDFIKHNSQPGDCIIFSYRQKNVSTWRQRGYTSRYLPLASNTTRRVPGEGQKSGVSFVGASMAVTSQTYLKYLETSIARISEDLELSNIKLRSLIASQLINSEYTADHEFKKLFPELHASPQDPAMLLGEVISSTYRFNIIERLAKFNVNLWGDEGWSRLQKEGVNYRGAAGHFKKLNEIYRKSLINIDIGRLYQSDIVTMRVFDILACKGFVLASHSDALAELFEIGSEIDSWRTPDELEEKVAWYLKNPDIAIGIAEKGYRRVVKDHTIQNRLRVMLDFSQP